MVQQLLQNLLFPTTTGRIMGAWREIFYDLNNAALVVAAPAAAPVSNFSVAAANLVPDQQFN